MKSFFSNHPVIASLFTGCMILIFLSFATFLTLVFVMGKSVSKIVETAELQKDYESSSKYAYTAGNKNSQNEFLVIPIKGIILTAADYEQPFYTIYSGVTYGYKVKEQIINASVRESIKGLILDIDSPGGTIGGAKAIYDGVRYYRDTTGKPVIAHVTGMGASGGYMAALPASEIIGDNGSLVGSIGVIMGPFKFYDEVISEGSILNSVTTENGIETFYITGGRDKDFGNPYKELSDSARDTLQKNVDNEYNRFVELVVQNRSISSKSINEDIGALIYENTTAKELGLIDGTGNKQDVYARIADLAKVSRDDFKIVTEEHNNFWNILSGFSTRYNNQSTSTCELCGQMLYLYGTPHNYYK